MRNKSILLLFMFIALSIKSQEYKKYDFEKQIKFVFNDSSYTMMQIAVNNHLIYEPFYKKYIEKEIVPLGFIILKDKKDFKKFDFGEIETFSTYRKGVLQDNPSISFDFSVLISPSTAMEKKSGADYFFTSYTNDLDIKFKKYINGSNKIEYYLKTFSIEKKSTPYDRTIQIYKKFSSKSHVFTNEFLNNCEKCEIEKIIYSNKISVLSKNKKENTLGFSIIVYDLVEKKYEEEPVLISRKVIIEGDRNESVDYLKKNKLDYQEVSPEKIIIEDFKDLD